jgi:mRNA deadenylase 3'-5' endonuclease subunit Ccr4
MWCFHYIFRKLTPTDYSLKTQFSSAYDTSSDYPTFCKGTHFSTIDFLWYSNSSVNCLAVREVIDEKDLLYLKRSRSGLPSYENPSDHLPIGAVFAV